MPLDPACLDALASLCIGFALSGLLASGYECATHRRAGFQLLEGGGATALVALPVVAFGAPFLILRDTLAGRRGAHRPFPFVMLATMAAAGWSLLSGRAAIDLVGLLAG